MRSAPQVRAVVPVQTVVPPAAAAPRPASYHDAVGRATPSVVNIFTSKEAPRNPLLNDPTFRRFFGDQFGYEAQSTASLGSGVIVSSTG